MSVCCCPLPMRFSQGCKGGPRGANPSLNVSSVPWKKLYITIGTQSKWSGPVFHRGINTLKNVIPNYWPSNYIIRSCLNIDAWTGRPAWYKKLKQQTFENNSNKFRTNLDPFTGVFRLPSWNNNECWHKTDCCNLLSSFWLEVRSAI